MAELVTGMEARQLTVSIPRLEVKTYRRVCAASDRIPKPPHFIYHLRCTWTGHRRTDLEFGSHEDFISQQKGESYWWDSLPSSYTVKRRWGDIQKFHNLVDQELAFDKQGGYRCVKTRTPVLPKAGELDAFLVSLAATGDVMALTRRRSEISSDLEDALEELDLLNTVYIDRLRPYFQEINKVLAEVPPELIQECTALRNFVTSGVSCKKRPPAGETFCGRGPFCLEPSHYIAEGKKELQRRAERAKSEVFSASRASSPRDDDHSKKSLRKKPSRQLTQGSSTGMMSRRASTAQKSDKGLLAQSSSLPALSMEALEGFEKRRSSVDELLLDDGEDDRFERLAASHYGFFAQRISKKDMAASAKDYWRLMSLKEKKEMGRRAMLLPLDAVAPPPSRVQEDLDDCSLYSARSFWLSTPQATSTSQKCSRLPSLPPPGQTEPFREDTSGLKRRPSPERQSVGLSSLMKKPAEKTEHMEVVVRDLCEGFQVLLLGEAAPQVPRSMRLKEPMKVYPQPGREQTMKVYRVYCNLLHSEGVDPSGELLPDMPAEKETKGKLNPQESRAFLSSAGRKAHEQARRRQRRHGVNFGQEQARISWPTILRWGQHMEDLSADFRYRSVTAALNRALQLWRKKQATPRQRQEGVDLSMMIQWTWPDVREDRVADMMQWILESELDKFRQPTPRLMDPHDRLILEALFHRLDENGVGSCAPEDIAGGEEETDESRKENIVDVETVKAVVGEDRIELLPFLELMCEISECGVRAHDGATEVLRQDGRKLVLQHRKAVGGKIWVFDGTPPEEEQCRRVADVFEAEVLRWRAAATANIPVATQVEELDPENEAEDIMALLDSDSEDEEAIE